MDTQHGGDSRPVCGLLYTTKRELRSHILSAKRSLNLLEMSMTMGRNNLSDTGVFLSKNLLKKIQRVPLVCRRRQKQWISE